MFSCFCTWFQHRGKLKVIFWLLWHSTRHGLSPSAPRSWGTSLSTTWKKSQHFSNNFENKLCTLCRETESIHPLLSFTDITVSGAWFRDSEHLQIQQTLSTFKQQYVLKMSIKYLCRVLSTAGCAFTSSIWSILKVRYCIFLWIICMR